MQKNHIASFIPHFKSHCCSLALILISLFTLLYTPTPTYALSSSIQTTVTAAPLPSRSNFEQAITNLETIENYSTYRVLDPSHLDQVTPFAKEYRYLFRLVDAGKALLIDYTNADPYEANTLLTAMKEALAACNLRFGIQAKKYQASQNDQVSENNQLSETQPSPNSPSSTTQPSTTNIAQLTSNNTTNKSSSYDDPDSTLLATAEETKTSKSSEIPDPQATESEALESEQTESPQNNIEVPATGDTSSEHQTGPLLYIIAAICAATAIIMLLSFSYHHTHRVYRPGRKIR